MVVSLADPLPYWGGSIAIVLAVAIWQSIRRNLDPWSMYLIGMAGFAGAYLGGGILASGFPTAHAHELTGGRAAIGALAGAATFGGMAARVRGESFLACADAAAPAVALGYAVYRIGCFLNGCCFGAVTDLPWAVSFPAGSDAFAAQVAAGLLSPEATQSLPVHPAQLYHAVAGLLGFVVLLRAPDATPGTCFALAWVFYGATRFGIEFLRGDTPPIVGPLDLNHLACLLLVVTGVVILKVRPSRAALDRRESAA